MIFSIEKTIFATIFAVLFGLGFYLAGMSAISNASFEPIVLGLIGTLLGAAFGWLLAKWRIDYMPSEGIGGVLLRFLGIY